MAVCIVTIFDSLEVIHFPKVTGKVGFRINGGAKICP